MPFVVYIIHYIKILGGITMSVQYYISHMDGDDLLEIVRSGTVMFEGSSNEYDHSLDKFSLTHYTSKVIH